MQKNQNPQTSLRKSHFFLLLPEVLMQIWGGNGCRVALVIIWNVSPAKILLFLEISKFSQRKVWPATYYGSPRYSTMSATWRAEKKINWMWQDGRMWQDDLKLYVWMDVYFLHRKWRVPARTRGIYKNILPHLAILPSFFSLVVHSEQDGTQHVLPDTLRDGQGRQGRAPHHGHQSRSHPLYPVQDSEAGGQFGGLRYVSFCLFGNSNSKEHYIFKLYVCKTRFFLNRSWTVPARTREISEKYCSLLLLFLVDVVVM